MKESVEETVKKMLIISLEKCIWPMVASMIATELADDEPLVHAFLVSDSQK